MDNKELLRRLALIKANPALAETIPQGEVLKILQEVIKEFNILKIAIDNGRIKGEKGDDGVSFFLTPDVDYPSLTRYDETINKTVTGLETNFAYAIDKLEKRVAELKDGEDADITDEDRAEIAQDVLSLIELPNFDELVTEQITRNSEAIRDALELLQGDARYKVEIPDVQGLEQALNELALIRGKSGGGIGRTQVYEFIRQAVADGTIPAGGSGSGIVETIVAGTGITVDDTDPANPIVSATGGGGAVDSVNGQTGVVVLDADDIDDTSTTHKFTTASDISKLAGIEAGADVTDATNVNAAGAVMNSDYTPAHSLLVQQSGTGSPTSLQIPNDTILGRLSGGGSDIDALTASDVRTLTETETTTQLNTRDTNNRNRANHTGTQAISTITGLQTALGDRAVRIIHGATASTARPSDATYVEWVGSVEPTNATDNDTWIQTA